MNTGNKMASSSKQRFGVIARLRGLPEKTDELRIRLKELARLTREEYGCLSCEMIENRSDATEFTLLAEWLDEKSCEAHFSTALIRKALQFLPGLLTRERDFIRHPLRSHSVRYGTNSYGLAAP